MKTPFNIIFMLLAFLPLSIASDPLTDALGKLPTCAIKCLSAAIVKSPCSLTDQTCICTNAELQKNVEVCVLKTCTIKQGLLTKNVTTTTCGAPIRDKSGRYATISTTLAVISAFCVLLRLGYKGFFTVEELGWDDWFIFITLLAGVPSSIINVRGTAANGLGRDIWTLTYTQITNFVRFFYIMEVLYFAQVTLLKLALLFFYYRIFPGKPVRLTIKATILFNVLFGISFVFTAIFQCRPINYYWNRWDGEHQGTCININALGWANAAISIALDIWMLAIPLSQLIHLKLAWKKKVGVALMFCVGTFVTVVSMLRLQYLVHFANSNNPTWDQWDVSNWSTVEINVGIMCACMPAIRVILVRLFPKVLGTTQNLSNQYYQKYGSSSRSRSKFNEISEGSSSGPRNKGGIAVERTFELSHVDHNDELRLMQRDAVTPGSTKAGSKGSQSSL